jgi:hypothetical protein
MGVSRAHCNIIFGRDNLQKVGMSHDYDQGTMTAFGITSSMKSKSFCTDPLHALANLINIDDDKND